jgi:hypothetical protein
MVKKEEITKRINKGLESFIGEPIRKDAIFELSSKLLDILIKSPLSIVYDIPRFWFVWQEVEKPNRIQIADENSCPNLYYRKEYIEIDILKRCVNWKRGEDFRQ